MRAEIRFTHDLIEDLVRDVVNRCLEELERDPSLVAISPEEALFYSTEAQDRKREMIAVGKKLWQREYVDGNGGNISFRLDDKHVLCTPTMVSKGDLTMEDISMVDLDNERICGSAPHTSEIRLHLAIYKANPSARAVVHCHPPHATAYAICGMQPPLEVLPEYEVFVGPAPLSPYESPGTQAFADTVIPYVREHNTILLSNHGVVCWAATVTHAEWLAEVLDTYCRTLILAKQLGAPITRIPAEKIGDLLRVKEKLGLPDARHNNGDAVIPNAPAVSTANGSDGSSGPREVERAKLASIIARQTLASLERAFLDRKL